MPLRRPTIDNVRALLEDGNYVQACVLAKSLSNDDPMIVLLADELCKVGNKKKNGKRGPRPSSDLVLLEVNGVPVKYPQPTTPHELLALMSYDALLEARDIVDGRSTGDIGKAQKILREAKLQNVTRQQFRAQARTAAAGKYKIDEEKLSKLIHK